MSRAPDPGRVCTVTTLKDTVDNARRFVTSNLAAGADHMFVFVDDADRAVLTALEGSEHVTAVPTGKGYWQGRRPAGLNPRQYVNANLTNLLLAPFDEVAWLFHIDGDECLDIDKPALLALDRATRAVSLSTLEAVSRTYGDGPATHFKYPLADAELQLLALLGVLSRPNLKAYFNGHVGGKPGLRPAVDLWLRIHSVEDSEGRPVPGASHDGLRVLHHESFSGAEFVRKWLAHADNGTKARFSGGKKQLQAAVHAVLVNPVLDEQRKRELLLRIHERHVQDDVETLNDLGYLLTPSPERHGHRPRGLSAEALAGVRAGLRELRAVDKTLFAQVEAAPEREELARRLALRGSAPA